MMDELELEALIAAIRKYEARADGYAITVPACDTATESRQLAGWLKELHRRRIQENSGDAQLADENRPLLLKPDEAFRALNISRSKGYAMLQSGELPSILVGRSRRIPRVALKRWIREALEQP